jgi:5,10-methylenetetrahydromethanopterin reductase
MDVSCSLPPGPDALDQIRLAESLGYRRAWLNDSPALYWDVWMTLAMAARETERIDLGVSVVVPSLRHVLVTASAVATLEHIAPGRAAVIVGTGFTGRCMLGQRPLSWSSVAQYVRALRALLQGDAVEVDGKLIQMRHLEGWAPPRPIPTPILIAANGPKGVAVAHELGDGVMAMGVPQTGFEWSVFGTAGTVLEAGEDLSSPRVFDALGPAIALAYHFTYEMAPTAVDALPGGQAWRMELEREPVESRHLALHDGHGVAPNERELPHLRPEVAAQTLTGSAQAIQARVDELAEAGVTELVYAPMGADVERELRAMAEAVAIQRAEG